MRIVNIQHLEISLALRLGKFWYLPRCESHLSATICSQTHRSQQAVNSTPLATLLY